jgi:hypothetical protein
MRMQETYVGEPVCTNSYADSFATVCGGEQLGRHDPVHASNAESEARDVQPDEYSSRPSSGSVLIPRVLVNSVQGADDELSDAHPNANQKGGRSGGPSGPGT